MGDRLVLLTESVFRQIMAAVRMIRGTRIDLPGGQVSEQGLVIPRVRPGFAGTPSGSPWVLIKIANVTPPAHGQYYAWGVEIDTDTAVAAASAFDDTGFTPNTGTYDYLARNLAEIGAGTNILDGGVSAAKDQVWFLAWKSGQLDDSGREVVYFDSSQWAYCAVPA